jgi:hypothetical protein
MEVLETKPIGNYKEDLKRLIKLLTYKKNKLELKGSASLSSQQFFSDYDLFCVIERPDSTDFYQFLHELITHLPNDTWFLELKLQTKGGKKVRVLPHGELKKEEWDKVWKTLDFVKIDLVSRMEGFFTEVSCIYSLTMTPPTVKEYKDSLMKDIRDLKREKKWYKILKRQFSLYKLDDNKEKMVAYSKIFNGELGKEYQVINRIDAMDKVLEHYQDAETVEKIRNGIKDLHLPPLTEKLTQWVASKSKKLNSDAKKFL